MDAVTFLAPAVVRQFKTIELLGIAPSIPSTPRDFGYAPPSFHKHRHLIHAQSCRIGNIVLICSKCCG